MFEKKAEEWVKENMDCCRTENCTGKDIPYFDEEERCCAKSAFQDGAEFGYNKAKEEWKKHFLQCSSPFCLDNFSEVKCYGELGNMAKKESE